MRRLASFALVLSLLSAAASASADPPPPPVDLERALEAIDEAMMAGCQVDLCLPPWYTDPGPYCVVFTLLWPGIPGVVDISWEGDVSVDGRRITDCYPYDGGAEFDLSDTYAAGVQYVVDLLTLLCEVDLCVPPPFACAVFASLTPGVPPAVVFQPDGDVEVAGHTVWDCSPYDPPLDPVAVVGQGFDVVSQILDALCDADVCTSEGPTLCPFFAKLSPGPLPEVVIGPDGDVEIAGRLVYTCPPYESR